MNWKNNFNSNNTGPTQFKPSRNLMRAHFAALGDEDRKKVESFMESNDCGFREAMQSLHLREFDMELAQEYFERSKIPDVMADKIRYPKWVAFLETINDKMKK